MTILNISHITQQINPLGYSVTIYDETKNKSIEDNISVGSFEDGSRQAFGWGWARTAYDITNEVTGTSTVTASASFVYSDIDSLGYKSFTYKHPKETETTADNFGVNYVIKAESTHLESNTYTYQRGEIVWDYIPNPALPYLYPAQSISSAEVDITINFEFDYRSVNYTWYNFFRPSPTDPIQVRTLTISQTYKIVRSRVENYVRDEFVYDYGNTGPPSILLNPSGTDTEYPAYDGVRYALIDDATFTQVTDQEALDFFEEYRNTINPDVNQMYIDRDWYNQGFFNQGQDAVIFKHDLFFDTENLNYIKIRYSPGTDYVDDYVGWLEFNQFAVAYPLPIFAGNLRPRIIGTITDTPYFPELLDLETHAGKTIKVSNDFS